MNDSTFFRGVVDATDSGESGLRFAAAQSYQLTRRHIYILPTRAGWMLAACLLTMLLGAINYNNSLAYALTFLLGSVAMVSILHTYRNQDGLSLRVAPAAPVHVEQLATFNFTIENPRPEPRVGLMVRYLDASGDDVPHPNIVRVGVPANDRVTIALARVATKRGQMQLGRVIVSNRYPFGIFRAWSVWDTSSRVLVYPLLRGEESLPTHAGDGDGEGKAEEAEGLLLLLVITDELPDYLAVDAGGFDGSCQLLDHRRIGFLWLARCGGRDVGRHGVGPPHRASQAVGLIKRAVQSGAEVGFHEGLAIERELQQQLFTDPEHQEGNRNHN